MAETLKRILDLMEEQGVIIDYLIRGKEIKTDALSNQEMDLVEGFHSLTDEARDVMLKNIRIPTCI